MYSTIHTMRNKRWDPSEELGVLRTSHIRHITLLQLVEVALGSLLLDELNSLQMRALSTGADVEIRHVIVYGSDRVRNQCLRYGAKFWRELDSPPWHYELKSRGRKLWQVLHINAEVGTLFTHSSNFHSQNRSVKVVPVLWLSDVSYKSAMDSSLSWVCCLKEDLRRLNLKSDGDPSLSTVVA